ncbi:MAG: hypothetical protein ACREH4_11780 [Vitreimonas sp.]
MSRSNTRRFVGAAWSLLWFQFIASAGAVGVTAWAVMEVSPRLAELRAQAPEIAPPAATVENKGAGGLTILGEAALGASLLAEFSADPEGPGSALRYQWLRDGAVVAGATAQVYQTTVEDAGRNLSVRVEYRDGAGFDESVTSTPIAIPAPQAQPPGEGQPPTDVQLPPQIFNRGAIFQIQPSFGSIDLRAGAEHSRDVRAGGAYDAASRIAANCRGYITSQPSFTLRYTAGGLPLNIGASSQMDTTIVVRAPDGSWHCNDDDNGFNPRVSWESPASGEYQIWVGRYGGVPNDMAAATLYISHHAPGVIR